MFTARYPAELHAEENGKGFWVSFPDLGEALTGGASVRDAMEQAADGLAEAIAGRIARGDEIPKPSRLRKRQHAVGVPLYLAPKFALYLAMRENGMTQTRLGQMLGLVRLSCGGS